MDKKELICIGIMIAFILFSGCIEEIPSTRIKTIYVDDDGGADFTNIQDAIDSAGTGDTVYVYSGIYYEQILIDKTINLIGENKDTVIIDGCEKGNVVNVSADHVNISGFTIRNSSGFVTGLAITGICVSANHTTISGNIITNNKGMGISIGIGEYWFPSNNTIKWNDIIDNDIGGIILSDSCSNTIFGNTIINHNFSVNFSSNLSTSTYSFGIGLYHSNNNTISDNIITNSSWYGISLYGGPSNNKIIRNVITSSFMGIGTDGSGVCYNYISDNSITDGYYGIVIGGHSSYTIITRNDIINNQVGIGCSSSEFGCGNNNTIYRNNFIDNNQSAYDSCINSWDNGSVGNYWSDYVWIDENDDGIGDIPYDILGGDNQDRYPLDKEVLDEENIGQSGYCTRLNNNQEWKAQSFRPDVDEITKLGVQLKRTSGATIGNYRIALHSDSGGEPGSLMKQQTFLLSDVSTSMDWYYYDFISSPVSVTPGDTYYVMVRLVSNQPAYEYVDWHMSSGNSYDKGVRWWLSNGGSSWHSSPEDAGFRVYGYGNE